MKRCSLSLILIVLLLSSSPLFSQTFTTTPYITLPGNNTNLDVVRNSFICWVNEVDSVYTLYMRQTSPDSGKNIVVFSDTGQIANPSICYINSTNYYNVRIAWQRYINNHWQILSREYVNDSLSGIISITDSLADNVNPSISLSIVAWIQNGNLIYKYFDSLNAVPNILDNANCSNPNVYKYFGAYPDIVYEKGSEGKEQVMEVFLSYSYNSSPVWSYNKISKGGNNINPRFGLDGSISYQTFVNSVWKVVYLEGDTTKNISYDFENPVSYSYPVPAKLSNTTTPPFFVVYDSDSLRNNRQIIFYTFNTAFNISNADGDNYLPTISFFELQDTTYIAIYWIHNQNGKEDIWRGYSKFIPAIGLIKVPPFLTKNFILNQNYPNPFNPSTVISWQLANNSLVTLKIYDILGNEIATLVNEYQNAGEHSIIFDASGSSFKGGLASGVYFYRLKAGNNTLTKKMLYLK